jgi:hypothetical protein
VTFIGLFNIVIVVSIVAFHAAGGTFKSSRRVVGPWKWLAVLWGLQAADVATTLVAFGIFDPSIEANHVAVAIGVLGMAVIKLILLPAIISGLILIYPPRKIVPGIRIACFISALVVVSNTTGLMEVARYLLLGYAFHF